MTPASIPERPASRPGPILRALGRVTTSGRLIPELDGFRFVAIACVVLVHLTVHVVGRMCGAPAPGFSSAADSTLYSAILQAQFGVQLFFVISGFVLALPFAEHHLLGQSRPSLKTYYVRRITRLEPPYVISLLLLFALAIARGRFTLGELSPHLLASVCYVHNQVYGEVPLLSAVAWSLEVEVQFYVLAPLLCLVFAVRGRPLRMGLIAVAMLILGQISECVIPWSFRYYASLPGQLHYFLAGFLLAEMYLWGWLRPAAKTYGWDAIGLAAWTGIAAMLVTSWSPRVLLPWLVIAAYTAGFRGRLLGAFFSNPWIYTTGGMCYTIYLYHNNVISTLGRATLLCYSPSRSLAANLALQLGLIGPMLVVICAVLFVLLERPFMLRDWPQRLAGRVKGLGCGLGLGRRSALDRAPDIAAASGQRSGRSRP